MTIFLMVSLRSMNFLASYMISATSIWLIMHYVFATKLTTERDSLLKQVKIQKLEPGLRKSKWRSVSKKGT
jgi:hypothetical protein